MQRVKQAVGGAEKEERRGGEGGSGDYRSVGRVVPQCSTRAAAASLQRIHALIKGRYVKHAITAQDTGGGDGAAGRERPLRQGSQAEVGEEVQEESPASCRWQCAERRPFRRRCRSRRCRRGRARPASARGRRFEIAKSTCQCWKYKGRRGTENW
jgi:hypothetical protein